MTEIEYWEECISLGAEECDLILNNNQLKTLAKSAQGGHENYGMAFYSPPPSDRINVIASEWKSKLDKLQAEYDDYRSNAETAVKKALRQHSDAMVSIGEYGEVTRYDGRITQIQ